MSGHWAETTLWPDRNDLWRQILSSYDVRFAAIDMAHRAFGENNYHAGTLIDNARAIEHYLTGGGDFDTVPDASPDKAVTVSEGDMREQVLEFLSRFTTMGCHIKGRRPYDANMAGRLIIGSVERCGNLVVSACRQVGLTTTLLGYALHQATFFKKKIGIYVSPYVRVKELADRFDEVSIRPADITVPGWLKAPRRLNASYFETENGSRVEFHNLSGEAPFAGRTFDVVIIDSGEYISMSKTASIREHLDAMPDNTQVIVSGTIGEAHSLNDQLWMDNERGRQFEFLHVPWHVAGGSAIRLASEVRSKQSLVAYSRECRLAFAPRSRPER